MSDSKWRSVFSASEPNERRFFCFFLLGVLCLVALFWYLRYHYELIWNPAVLISVTSLVAWIGFYAVEMYPKRRKKIITSYDFLWILFGILALLTQSWKQFDSITANQLTQEKEILQSWNETLQKRASFLLKNIRPTSDKYIGDKQLIPELVAFAEKDNLYLFTHASNFSKNSNQPNYLSDFGLEAYAGMSDLIAHRNSVEKNIEALYKKLKENGTPFWIQLFGSLLISLGLGLRLAKAISDMKEAYGRK